MLVKQISVFVENKFGRLADIIGILGDCQIDISALSIADTTDFGILRMIVNDPEKAEKVLRDAGITVKTTEVLALSVKDEPGGLASVLKQFKANHITIEYMYAFIGKSDEGALVVIRVDKPEQAIQTLNASSVHVVDAADIYRL